MQKIKIPGIIFLAILSQVCLAQVKVTKLAKNSIPKSISYNGNIVEAVSWKDSLGNNIVLLTATDITQSKTDPDAGSEAALYAYHFIVSNDSCKQTWRVYDFIKDCPVDMFLHFIDKSLAVTDLDKDGKAETWMIYKVSCQGDVSPVTMKLIMYENDKKFASRGTTRVQVSENRFDGGDHSFDEAFKNGPAAFRQYADKLWKKHYIETWK